MDKRNIIDALLKLRHEPIGILKGDPLDIPCNEQSDSNKLCQHPLVSVCMTTYNQENYIRQAIEGVMMQKTDFEFELVIGEDCSTDRTREICFEYQKKHPDKIRVLWSDQNTYQHPHPAGGNGGRVVAHCRGEYIALCEGDDWWSNRDKLQKQIDVFRSNPDVSIVYTDFQVYHQRQGRLSNPQLKGAGFFGHISSYTVKDYLTERFPHSKSFGFFATASIMYCRQKMDKFALTDPLSNRMLSLGDYQLRTRGALCGTVGFVQEPCAVYRLGSGVLMSAVRSGDIKMAVDIIYVHLVRTWDLLTENEKRDFLFESLKSVLRTERCDWRTKFRVAQFYGFIAACLGLRTIILLPKLLIVFHVIPQSLLVLKRKLRSRA